MKVIIRDELNTHTIKLNSSDNLHIHIVANGIICSWPNEPKNYKEFYPWHRILFISGIKGEFEHELDQLFYIGISRD